jgi:hypothetical protein
MKRIAICLALAWSLQPAGAMVRGTTDQGYRFLSGGADAAEISTVNSEKSQYALAILTAAKGTGAYLADVRIRITDEHAKPVLETVMDGPWLLVNLPGGRYEVEATLHGRAHKSAVTLHGGDHHEEVFYFDTHDEVEAPAN